MELLLIPVLLISGAVLVYLGAGGGHPFNQQDPLLSASSSLSQGARELSAAPAGRVPVSDSTGPAAWPLSAETIDEPEAPGASAGDEDTAAHATLTPPVEAPHADSKARRPQVTGQRINRVLPRIGARPNILVTSASQSVSAPAPPAVAAPSYESLQSDVLLTDLLSELIEMRRELKEVGGKVDALFEAQRPVVPTSTRPLSAFKPAPAEG